MVQNIISGSEHKRALEHLRRNTQRMIAGKKNHRRKTNYFMGKYTKS